MDVKAAHDVIALNQKLLDSIVAGDWKTYESLCDASISCFEAEARGQLVTGMPFHKFYFDLPSAGDKPAAKKLVTMASPHVRMLGTDAAVISYVRLTQSIDASGSPQTSKFEETRVWQKIDGHWKHVHFHRSQNA
jgi:calcium/calmodulin-dependent protein kinase (CaM kinase) II